MINHNDKIIFFHVPKNAGLSVGSYFNTYTNRVTDHRTIYELLPFPLVISEYLNLLDFGLIKRFIRNPTLGRKRINLKIFNTYNKIAVVRNPYSRVVSWYRNVMTDTEHLKKHGGKKIDFNNFIEKYLHDSWALRTQLDWVSTPDTKYKVNYIIKYENLKNDVISVANKINYKSESKIPEYHANKQYDWRYYYKNNKQIINFVRSKYRKEFEMFNYSMDINA